MDHDRGTVKCSWEAVCPNNQRFGLTIRRSRFRVGDPLWPLARDVSGLPLVTWNSTLVSLLSGFAYSTFSMYKEAFLVTYFWPAFSNRNFVDKVNNYSCICNAGFTGRNCDVVIKTCSSDSCYPGVPCNENSNSIYCGSCPFGFTGDGKNCEGNFYLLKGGICPCTYAK